MTANYIGLLDLAIAVVPVLALGIWQLVSINREIAKGRKPPEDS